MNFYLSLLNNFTNFILKESHFGSYFGFFSMIIFLSYYEGGEKKYLSRDGRHSKRKHKCFCEENDMNNLLTFLGISIRLGVVIYKVTH